MALSVLGNAAHAAITPLPERAAFLPHICVPQLVAAPAESSPNATALSKGPERLTYAELNRDADQLAGYLQSLGVGPEVPVGICLERSFDYVIAALAVWKAGGAYLPLDPAWPKSRREFILEDSEAAVLITRDGAARARTVVNLNRATKKIARAVAPSKPEIRPNSLAYIIYTSGATGRPNGVEVTHASSAQPGYLASPELWDHAAGSRQSPRRSGVRRSSLGALAVSERRRKYRAGRRDYARLL